MFTWYNHAFRYWERRPGGQTYITTFDFLRTLTVDGPIDLYAIWAANPSPIMFDLDGNGIRTTSLANGVMFDFAGDGNPVKTAWADQNCGFLVRDLNKNGQIDNGSELFGNFTVLKNGDLADNGFDALAELDLNGDGIIDRSEATAAGIMIWQDKNTNGKVDPGEMLTLEQAGILNIQTRYVVSHTTDANGNTWRWQSIFTRSSGVRSVCVDILFITE